MLHAALIFVGADEGFVGEDCWLQDASAYNLARLTKDFLHDLEEVELRIATSCHWYLPGWHLCTDAV